MAGVLFSVLDDLCIWQYEAADIPLTVQHQKKGGTKSVSLGVEIHGMMLTDPSRIASSMREI